MADDGGRIHTITIPGVSDILIIPPLDDESARAERISRIRRSNSAVPQSLNWVAQVINWIDNQQDLLITILTLSKPILRKIPARFVPYLGWVLFASDMMNLANMFLSAPLTGPLTKRAFLRETKRAVAGRSAVAQTARTFLLPGRVKFLPFLLQAGQVLENWTGWGIRLGAVMATISDTFWHVLTEPNVSRVRIVPPIASDPIFKAAQLLSQSYMWGPGLSFMTPEEIQLGMIAQNGALSILGAPNLPALDDARLEKLAETPIPLFDIWNPASKLACEKAGAPTDLRMTFPLPAEPGAATYGPTIRYAIAAQPDIDVKLAEIVQPAINDMPVGQMCNEAAQTVWDAFGANLDLFVPLSSPYERMLSIALEIGIAPPFIVHPVHPRWPVAWTDQSGAFGPWTPQPLSWLGPAEMYCVDDKNRLPELDWTYPVAYPPPSENPYHQIIWWCAIGLALWCGKAVQIPIYIWDGDNCTYRINGWQVNRIRQGFESMRLASYLVWGNAYKLKDPMPPREPTPSVPGKLRQCVRNVNGYYTLTGQLSDPEWIEQVMSYLPRIHTLPTGWEERKSAWLTPRGRDWLDGWINAVDPRRQRIGEAPFPMDGFF